MADPTTFDARLADAFERYFADVPTAVNAAAVTASVATPTRRQSGWLPWRTVQTLQPTVRLALVALVIPSIVALALVAGALPFRLGVVQPSSSEPGATLAVTAPPTATEVPPTQKPGVAPTPRFTPDPNPPASQAVYLRNDPSDSSLIDVVVVRADGQERLIRQVSTTVQGNAFPLGQGGSVSPTGWIAISTEASGQLPVAAYELIDLKDPARDPLVVPYPQVIGGQWSVDGLFALSSAVEHSPTGWMQIDIVDPRAGTTRHLGVLGLFGGQPSIVWAADGSGLLDGDRLRPVDGSPDVPIHPDLTFDDRRIGAGMTFPSDQRREWGFTVPAGQRAVQDLFAADGRALIIALMSTDRPTRTLTIAKLAGPASPLETIVEVPVPADALENGGYDPFVTLASRDDTMFLVGYWGGHVSNPMVVPLLAVAGQGTPIEHAGWLVGFLPDPLAASLPGLGTYGPPLGAPAP